MRTPMNVKQKEGEAKPSRYIMGNGENRREFLDLLSVFFTKYLVIFSATYKMFRHPHTFVDHIDESRTGIKRALIYFIESIVLVFVIPPHLLKGERSIGFIEQEFIVVGFAAYIAIIAFTHYLILCALERRKLNLRSTMILTFYAYGLMMLCLSLLTLIEDVSKLKPNISGGIENAKFWISIFAIYGMYVSVIAFHRWVGEVNNASAWKSFAALFIGLVFYNLVIVFFFV